MVTFLKWMDHFELLPLNTMSGDFVSKIQRLKDKFAVLIIVRYKEMIGWYVTVKWSGVPHVPHATGRHF